MRINAVLQNEDEQTLKKIRAELYFLYIKELQSGPFTEKLVADIKNYVQRRIKEEEQKMRWFPYVWSDENPDMEFAVSIKLVVKNKKELTIRMGLNLIKSKSGIRE